MLTDHSGLSRFERLLTLFTRVRPGEGRSALLFMLHAFLLLFSYQVVKALREAFMLAKFTAEVRSYAVAITALILMLLVPVYGAVRRRIVSSTSGSASGTSAPRATSQPAPAASPPSSAVA